MRKRVGHAVDGVGQRGDLALGRHRELLRQIAVGHRGHDLDDAAHLAGQVGRHQVDVVGEVLPGAGDALHLGLAAELALGADLLGHAGDLGRESTQLIHHGVDRALELEDLAPGLDGDLLREVAVGHRGGDERDVSHLGGEVTGQEVDVVGEVLPGAGDTLDLGLAAQLSLGADLAGHAGHFGGDQTQAIHQLVDRGPDAKGIALHRSTVVLERHLVGEVAFRDVGDDPGDLLGSPGHLVNHAVDAIDTGRPGAGGSTRQRSLGHLTLAADRATDTADFEDHAVGALDHLVERPAHRREHLVAAARGQADREISIAHRAESVGQILELPFQVAGIGIHQLGSPRTHHPLGLHSATVLGFLAVSATVLLLERDLPSFVVRPLLCMHGLPPKLRLHLAGPKSSQALFASRGKGKIVRLNTGKSL